MRRQSVGFVTSRLAHFYHQRTQYVEKVMFSPASVCLSTGGPQSQVLSLVSGPMSFLGGGYPSLSQGVTQSKLGVPQRQIRDAQSQPRGYPSPRWGGGVPKSETGGTPLARSGWGTPPPQARSGWVTSPPRLGWGTPTPSIRQQSEHLLRGGQYASCVHAGGLSYHEFSFYSLLCNILVWSLLK